MIFYKRLDDYIDELKRAKYITFYQDHEIGWNRKCRSTTV